MKLNLPLLGLFLLTVNCIAQTVQSVEVYNISQLKGQQVYYASHIKSGHMKDSSKIDDVDRLAMLSAVGKTGISMPFFEVPYVEDTSYAPAELTILTAKFDDGITRSIAKLEHKGGIDKYIVQKNGDTITLLLIDDGVTQVYTIHKNVTFPDNANLITCTTTRNRPLGVTTVTVCGKATLTK